MAPNKVHPHKYITKINGEHLMESRALKHGDRLLFGACNFFVYVDPRKDYNLKPTFEQLFEEAYAESLFVKKDHGVGGSKIVEILLKIAEANLICQELGKNFFYEPVLSEDHHGVKLAVQLYVDRANKKTFALLTQEVFSEIVFFDLSKKH